MTCLTTAVPALGFGPGLPAEAALAECSVTQELDLNADGYDDAVVGNPYATVSGRAEAGTVTILYGDADGRIGEGVRRVLTQASVAGSNVEAGDHFGWSVGVRNFTGDNCGEIVVGAPGEDWDGHADAGVVHLITFPADARGRRDRPEGLLVSQDDIAGGAVETGDQFGSAVSVGGWPTEPPYTLAVGAPGEDVTTAAGRMADAGEVAMFCVCSLAAPAPGLQGLGVAGRRLRQGSAVRPGTPVVPGTPEAGDRFGAAVLVSPLSWPYLGDGEPGPYWSVLVGAPGDVVSGHDGAGTVTAQRADGSDVEQFSQDSAGVPGVAETGDGFGSSVAAGRGRGSGHRAPVVAVGSPGEDVRDVTDAGSVTLLTSGLGLQPELAVDQDTSGIPGTGERGDRFGHSLAFRGDGVLGVGVPYEDVGNVRDAGRVQMLAVGTTGLEASVTADVGYTENSTGTPGAVTANHRFGLGLAGLDGESEDLLTISSPYAGSGSVFVVAARPGSLSYRSWVPGRGGIPGTGGGRFGWSVAGFAG